jgi:hypothetical protein
MALARLLQPGSKRLHHATLAVGNKAATDCHCYRQKGAPRRW